MSKVYVCVRRSSNLPQQASSIGRFGAGIRGTLLAAGALCLGQAIAAPQPAVAIEYHITNVGYLNTTPGPFEEFRMTTATGINGSGQVVGFSEVVFERDGLIHTTDHAFHFNGSEIVDLTPTPGAPGYDYSGAYGISDNGLVTGFADASDFAAAFVYSGGSLELLDRIPVESPARDLMYGLAINNAGKVVGGYEDVYLNGVADTGFYFDGAMSVRVPTLGGLRTTANDINEQGLITGKAEGDVFSIDQAYIYDGTTMRDLGTLPGGYRVSEGLAINELGQVTGWAYDASLAQHAFFFDGDMMHDLGTLGGTRSTGRDINDHGQIVGDFYDANGTPHGFLYDPLLGMIALDDLLDPALGWRTTSGVGINNAGQIVVNAYQPGEVQQALILTPVPEPSGILLGAFALLGIVPALWRSRCGSRAKDGAARSRW